MADQQPQRESAGGCGHEHHAKLQEQAREPRCTNRQADEHANQADTDRRDVDRRMHAEDRHEPDDEDCDTNDHGEGDDLRRTAECAPGQQQEQRPKDRCPVDHRARAERDHQRARGNGKAEGIAPADLLAGDQSADQRRCEREQKRCCQLLDPAPSCVAVKQRRLAARRMPRTARSQRHSSSRSSNP